MRTLAPPASIAGRSAPSLFFLPRIYDFDCSSLGIHHRSTLWSPWRHSWPHLRLRYRQETRDGEEISSDNQDGKVWYLISSPRQHALDPEIPHVSKMEGVAIRSAVPQLRSLQSPFWG